MKYLHVIEGTK